MDIYHKQTILFIGVVLVGEHNIYKNTPVLKNFYLSAGVFFMLTLVSSCAIIGLTSKSMY